MLWPKMPLRPASTMPTASVSFGSSHWASQTQAAPLSASSSAVSSPADNPAARMALVPPVRPLPTCRTSCPETVLTMT